MKKLLGILIVLLLSMSLFACSSEEKSSSSKKDKKSSSDSKDKDKKDSDKKDSDDKSDAQDALSDLFGKLKGDSDDKDSKKDSDKKGSSSKNDYRVYCHVATYEAGELVWQVYEEDIDLNNGVSVSFDYDKDNVQYNWTFIDSNAFSNLSASSPSGNASITVYSAGGQDDRGKGYINYSDTVITLDWDYGVQDVFIAFNDDGSLAKPIEQVVSGYDNYSSGSGSGNGGSASGIDYGDDDGGEYQGPRTDESIDLSGLSSKHGKAYVYIHTQNGYRSDDEGWVYSDDDGYIHDGDMVMEHTLTVYRFKDHTDIEYMLSYAGNWGEYWHVEYNYPAQCVFFDYVEGGTVTISGNQAIWEDESGYYREIYTLQSTREFDN